MAAAWRRWRRWYGGSSNIAAAKISINSGGSAMVAAAERLLLGYGDSGTRVTALPFFRMALILFPYGGFSMG